MSLSQRFTDIADAIRTKKGTSNTMTPAEMPAEIASIPTGGGAIEEKDVNFYDWDGKLLHSYTLAEAQALTALPELPTGPSDYTADSWTETLAYINALTSPFNIGVNYSANKEETEIDIEIDSDNLGVYYYPSNTSSIYSVVDWGDSSTPETYRGGSGYHLHTYQAPGNYTIKINGTEASGGTHNSYVLMGGNLSGNPNSGVVVSSRILNYNSSSSYFNKIVKNIRIGNKAELKNYAFYSCSELQKLIIPNNINILENSSLQYCNSLKSVVIPSSITSIGSSVFDNCSSLQSIVIPSSVTSIGANLCYSCSSLKSITIPSSATNISQSAFQNNHSICSVVIQNGITRIADNAFSTCYALKSITIPNSVISIGQSAFQNCNFLKEITFSNSLTSISDYICQSCAHLQTVSIPNGVTTIGYRAFFSCSSLYSITIPNSVTSIGQSAFQNCNSLYSITIPNSVTSIGSQSFYYCISLKEITMPSNVISIGNQAFYYCLWLESVHMEPTTPPTLGTNAFQNNKANRKIYVPYSADHSILNAYKAATNWSTYADYIEEEPQA